MIPIFHIITFFDFLFCMFIVVRVFISDRKKPSQYLKMFFFTFLSLGAYFGFLSLPGLVINDPGLVQIIYIFSYGLMFATCFFMFLLSFKIFSSKLSYVGMVLSLFLMAFVFVISILNYSPASIKTYGNFYFWWDGVDWIQTLVGVFAGFLVLSSSILYFVGGFKSREPVVRTRAFRIAAGLLTFLGASFAGYILSAVTNVPFIKFISTTLGVGLAIFALMLIASAVYYQPPKTKNTTG